MLGLMQDWPLLVHRVLDHAARWHGATRDRFALRRRPDPPHHLCANSTAARGRWPAPSRSGWASSSARSSPPWPGTPGAISKSGTPSWGWAASSTPSIRACSPTSSSISSTTPSDRWIFTDLSFVPLFEKLQDKLPSVEGFIVMTDRAHMPAETALRNPLCYEELIAEGDAGFAWPQFDENTACGMCYTSGTTGNPKGVVYSHRSNVLHAHDVLPAPKPWIFRAAIPSCRWFRCSMPMPGRWPFPRPWPGPSW